MYKKILSVILAITTLVSFSGFAKKEPEIDISTPQAQIEQSVLEYPNTNEDFRYDVFTYYVTITECLSTKNNIIIPDTIQDLPVYKIASGAFKNQKTITSLTMTNNIIEIGESAFSGCENLTSLNLSKNLTSCGSGAFSNCDNIKSVVIPSSLNTIPSTMFSSCDRLTAVIVEDSETKPTTEEDTETETSRIIESSAFSQCKMLKNVWIPPDITEINSSAFSGSFDNLTIYGQAQSSAAHYASENLIDFVVLNKNDFQTVLNSSIALDKKSISETAESSFLKIDFDAVYSLRSDFNYIVGGTTKTKKINPSSEILILCFSVRNISATSQFVNLLEILPTIDGYEKKVSTFGELSVPQITKHKTSLVGEIKPNETMTGYIAIEAPSQWKNSTVQFIHDTELETFIYEIKSSDTKIVYIGTPDVPVENNINPEVETSTVPTTEISTSETTIPANENTTETTVINTEPSTN